MGSGSEWGVQGRRQSSKNNRVKTRKKARGKNNKMKKRKKRKK